MKRKLNTIALALFVTLAGILPIGCQNQTSTTQETTNTDSTIIETTTPSKSNHESESSPADTSKIVSPTPEISESNSKIESSPGDTSKTASPTPEISESNSKIESSPGDTSKAASHTPEPSKSNSKIESSPGEISSSKPETSNSNPKSQLDTGSQPHAPVQEASQASTPAPASQPSKTPIENSPSPTLPSVVNLNTHSLTLTVGDTYQLSATIEPYDADDQQLTWQWSDTAVITIDQKAVVHAVGAGTATITVKTNNNKQDTCKVTVKAKEQPKPVEQSSKPTETSKPTQISTPTQPSKPAEPSQQSEVSAIDPLYAPYYAPYDWDAVIADLRKVGEEQYGMTWEESLWVADRGLSYGSKFDYESGNGYDSYNVYDPNTGKTYHQGCCGFGFPVSIHDARDGADLREECTYMFENLVRRFAKNNETIDGCFFKIFVEDCSDDARGTKDYWIYLLYT